MRQTKILQPNLKAPYIDHDHAKELEVISRLISDYPTILQFVCEDLNKSCKSDSVGRPGMSAEQVLKAALIKQISGLTYRKLSFHLMDSLTYASFTGYGPFGKVPIPATLQANISKITPETWEKINGIIIEIAGDKGIENGKTIRADSTTVKSNIHYPTDASLLTDCVFTLNRIFQRIKSRITGVVTVTDHTRRAKRRHLGIVNAKTPADRQARYKDLINVTRKTVHGAERAIENIEMFLKDDPQTLLYSFLQDCRDALKHFAALSKRVIDQTVRRVVFDQKVPSAEKIVSIFEEHTDIIDKGKREVVFGHKIDLSTGKSGLILSCCVLEGNPADSSRTIDIIEDLLNDKGLDVQQASFDGGYASKANLLKIKLLGITDVAFSKGRGIPVEEMVRSTWVYRKLRNFRAGIEAVISYLKRSFGMRMCNWHGWAGFKKYIGSLMVSYNFLLLAKSIS